MWLMRAIRGHHLCLMGGGCGAYTTLNAFFQDDVQCASPTRHDGETRIFRRHAEEFIQGVFPFFPLFPLSSKKTVPANAKKKKSSFFVC